jgi:hypothetical protein
VLVNELGTTSDTPLPPPPEPVDAPGPAKGDIPGVPNENLAKPDVGWEGVEETADGDAPEPEHKTDTQPLQDSGRSDSLGELRDGDAAKYEAQTELPEDGDPPADPNIPEEAERKAIDAPPTQPEPEPEVEPEIEPGSGPDPEPETEPEAEPEVEPEEPAAQDQQAVKPEGMTVQEAQSSERFGRQEDADTHTPNPDRTAEDEAAPEAGAPGTGNGWSPQDEPGEAAVDIVEQASDAANEPVALTSFEADADALTEDLSKNRGLTTDTATEPEPSEPDDGPPDTDDASAQHDDGPAEGAFMDRLRDLVGAGRQEADRSERLADTVHRPDFQNPLRERNEIPDRYGTPLDRADGTRTPLFHGVPSREQAKQGALRDCGVIATLGAVATRRPDAIHACVQETEDGNYAVKLHETKFNTSLGRYEATGHEINLTVTSDLPVFDASPDEPAYADSVRTGAAWGPILEKAIAGADQTWNQDHRDRWAELSEVRKDPEVPEGYVRLDKGSRPSDRAELLTQLTGEPSVVEDFPTQYDRNGRSPDAQLMGDIRQRLAEGKPIVVGTKSLGEAGGVLSHDLEPEHAYEVTAVDDRARIHLHNPWNSAHPEPLTLKQFRDNIRPYYSTLE